MKISKEKQKFELIKGLILITKIAVASGVSWEVAKLFGSKHPYLAPLTVILSIQETIQHSAMYAFYRIIGTLFGIASIILIIKHLEVNGWTIGLLLAIGMILPVLLRVHKTIIYQIALTILLVFVFVHKTSYYATDRIRDTIIGALVAVIIQVVIFPPNYVKEANRTLSQFGLHLGQLFAKTAYWVNNNCNMIERKNLMEDTTSLLQELHQVEKEFKKAEKSLRLNPFTKNENQILKKSEQFLVQLKQGYTYISGVLGTFSDWAEADYISTLDRQKWSIQIQMLGKYITEQIEKTSETSPVSKASFDLLDLSSIPLQINISPELEFHRYQLSLYNDTIKLMKNLGGNDKK
ncbi:FUSC family protein [Priestia megaterium]|uniref:FUSC family protein n=1 Tax=Priestia megaterium TaxID=1404 RepID=UPI00159C1A72|nr:FUSC family protein [Priestia megaterium]